MIWKINTKKLSAYKAKALFLIAPVALLITLGIVVSSQVSNINQASDDAIFATAKESAKLIEMEKPREQGGFGRTQETTDYTDTDVVKVEGVDGVKNATLIDSVPLNKITATGLFSQNFNLSLSGVDKDLASLYTSQDFGYTEGGVIPVILNSSSFTYTYEDWQGKDSFEINLQNMRNLSQEERDTLRQNFSPLKTSAITYNKEELLGKEFVVEVGGLSDLSTTKTTMDFSTFKQTITKKTEAELATELANQKTAISEYWDYTKISTPLKYTFKVVGVVENGSTKTAFVPEEFANKVFADLTQNQLNARTSKDLGTDVLGVVYQGISFDGYKLDTSITDRQSQQGGAQPGGVARPGAEGQPTTTNTTPTTSYIIPGLILKTDSTSQSTSYRGSSAGSVTGTYAQTDAYTMSAKESSLILIQLDDVLSRSNVVESLNTLGYAFTDNYDLGVFEELDNTLNSASQTVMVAFVAISGMILIFTLGKFVSESRREIGVFRALGASKTDIKKLFVSQAILYTAIGYVIGAVGGIIGVFALAIPAQNYFVSFVSKTVEETFNVVLKTDAGTFMRVDWSSFAVYSLLLLGLTLIISYWQAHRASRVSPVEAIRGE